VVSAQLKQLETKYGIVESISIGKNKIYKIEERFFNIWYLMRFGRKKDRQKIEWLVKFLVSWCSPDELEVEDRANRFVDSVKLGRVKESYIYHMCEALSYAGLDIETEHNMKKEVKEYLTSIDSKFLAEVSESDKEIIEKVLSLYKDNRINEAIQLLIKSQKNYKDSKNYYNTYIFAIVLLWVEEFSDSYNKFLEWLEYDNALENEKGIRIYLNLLIAKGQLYKAKEFFEITEYQFKDRYKPIWYALMTLMQDEFPHEIKKMGSELKESVDEILQQVAEFQKKYSLS